MSALLDILPPESDEAAALDPDRCTITVRPLVPIQPTQTWTFDSYALPIPDCVKPYVRDAGKWRLIVHRAIEHYTGRNVPFARRKAEFEEYRRFLFALMYLGPDSKYVGQTALRLFPPQKCKGCHSWYLPITARVVYCSDECYRIWRH